MKKIKRLYTKNDNFTEPIALSTDLNTIDISDILQAKLTEKGISAENFEEAIIAMLDNSSGSGEGGIKVVASTIEPENMNPGDVWIKTVPAGGDLANATVELEILPNNIYDGNEKTVVIKKCYIETEENSALDYIRIEGDIAGTSVQAYQVKIIGLSPFYGSYVTTWQIISSLPDPEPSN